MKVIDNVKTLKAKLSEKSFLSTGFVPTMGALHSGHISLVKASVEANNMTVVSIFVNPTQFNDASDLNLYPRNIDKDLKLLEDVLGDNDIVFTPSYDDLYKDEQAVSINLAGLDRVMEGKHRPGHFEGVIRVVKLLFEAVNPSRAYFGQKDFQQLSIIRKMVRELQMNIEIVACPIMRENTGLAMSSRNERLSPDLRKEASIIHSTLRDHCIVQSAVDIASIENKIISRINSNKRFKVEYFEIVDDFSLQAIQKVTDINPERSYYGCIAVFAGDIRLIDNMEFSFLFLKG